LGPKINPEETPESPQMNQEVLETKNWPNHRQYFQEWSPLLKTNQNFKHRIMKESISRFTNQNLNNMWLFCRKSCFSLKTLLKKFSTIQSRFTMKCIKSF
jgi:hypothetical protein